MSRSTARLLRLPARVRGASERGAAAVEFALVAPLLLLLLVGLTEFGRAYTTQATLSQAARLGADVVVRGGTAAEARATVRAAAVELAPTDADIGITPGTACVGTTAPTPVVVTVTNRQVFLTGMFGSGLTLTGQATMRCRG